MNARASDSGWLRISTDALPARDRVAGFRELFGREIMRLEIEALPGAPFSVDMAMRIVPGLGIMQATHSPQRLGRTRQLITDGDDSLVLQISNQAGTVSQLGREAAIAPGEAVVVSNADIGALTFPSASKTLALRLPRRAIEPLLCDKDAVLVRAVPRDNDALRLLVHYLGFFNEEEAVLKPELQRLAAVHVHDLLSLVLGATRDAAAVAERRGVRAARLRAIKADIVEHLDEPRLDAAAVAQQARRVGKLSPQAVRGRGHVVLGLRPGAEADAGPSPVDGSLHRPPSDRLGGVRNRLRGFVVLQSLLPPSFRRHALGRARASGAAGRARPIAICGTGGGTPRRLSPPAAPSPGRSPCRSPSCRHGAP